MAANERKTEVIDLWSEDTKQDAWFTQSALDIGFQWLESVYPGFSVYLFSGEFYLQTSQYKNTKTRNYFFPGSVVLVQHLRIKMSTITPQHFNIILSLSYHLSMTQLIYYQKWCKKGKESLLALIQ